MERPPGAFRIAQKGTHQSEMRMSRPLIFLYGSTFQKSGQSENILLGFLKNPDENMLFMEKFDFEKIFLKNKIFKKENQQNSHFQKYFRSSKFLEIFFWRFFVEGFFFKNIFSKSNFFVMRKYFSSRFFLDLKRFVSAIQRTQTELLGVSEQETLCKTKQW